MTREPRYSKEEMSQRGKQIYRSKIQSQFEAENKGRIVAIDIETQEFEIADTLMLATDALFARVPDAQIWCERFGYPAVHHHYGRGVTRS